MGEPQDPAGRRPFLIGVGGGTGSGKTTVAERLAASGDFDGIVIGGDSMFEVGGRVYGKPYTTEEATRRWHEMRGATGILHSGHSVFRISPGATPPGWARSTVSSASPPA